LHDASRNTLELDGHEEMVGATLSFKVIVNEHELELPAASVAVRVTNCLVLCPVSTVPDTGDCVSVAVPQLSVTVAVYAGRVNLHDASRNTLALEGQFVITGATFSITLTVKLQVEELPAASTAL